MSSRPENHIRMASESDRKTDSEVGSNERTNERTDAADRIGRQSGAGSRRTGAYEKDSPISEHSPEVSYYLARARESFREASAAIHKRDIDRVAPVRAALAAERDDAEESA